MFTTAGLCQPLVSVSGSPQKAVGLPTDVRMRVATLLNEEGQWAINNVAEDKIARSTCGLHDARIRMDQRPDATCLIDYICAEWLKLPVEPLATSRLRNCTEL